MLTPANMSRPDAAQEARFRLALGALDHAIQRAGGLPPSATCAARASIVDALRTFAEDDAARLDRAWECALAPVARAVLLHEAERVASIYVAVLVCATRRNAAPEAPAPLPTRAEQEAQFQAVIDSFNMCLAKVQTRSITSGGGFVPFMAADLYFADKQTENLRADRDRLRKRWADAKTDAERIALIATAKMWYLANSRGLGGCKGIVPSMGDAMVDQAAEYIHDAKEAIKKGAGGLFSGFSGLLKPMIWVGAGVGGLLLLTALMPAVRRHD